MSRKPEAVPAFATEAEERAYWESTDSADRLDWSKARRATFPRLKPTTTSISLRLPVALLDRIKVAASSPRPTASRSPSTC